MFNSIIEKGSGVSMNYLEDIFNLKEKVVVITGAIGQIGRQICKAYRATGSKVIGVDIKALGVPLEGVDFFTADITKKSTPTPPKTIPIMMTHPIRACASCDIFSYLPEHDTYLSFSGLRD